MGTRLRSRAKWLSGGTFTPVAGVSATAFSITPNVHYHPHSQAGAVTKVGERVVACPDIRGLASVSGYAVDGTTVIGPYEMTDLSGRKFWRFKGAEALFVANTLNGIDQKACGVFWVGRLHSHRTTHMFFNPRYLSYTSNATNTTATVTHATARFTLASNGAPSISNFFSSNAAEGYKTIPPCNLHAGGVASRTTALGGQRVGIQTDAANMAQAPASATGMVGAVIGATPAASNAFTASLLFDLYELAFYNRTLTDADFNSIRDDLLENYGLTAFTSQHVFEGDSITHGVATALPVSPLPDYNIAMQISEPGTSYIPASKKILNSAVSGSQSVATAPNGTPTSINLEARKNSVTSAIASPLPGGIGNNSVSVLIARNDITSGNKNSLDWYNDMVYLINNATAGIEGYLQRGFSVVIVSPIATSASALSTNLLPGETTGQGRIEGIRARIFDTGNTLLGSFLTDLQANSGQAYEGRVTGLAMHLITTGGNTVFSTAADAANTAAGFYNSDSTHLVKDGITAQLTGLDTPQYGYGSVI